MSYLTIRAFDSIKDNDEEKLTEYLEDGGWVNIRNDNSETLLMYAIKEEKFNLVKILIENGASLVLETNDGKNAVNFAANSTPEINQFVTDVAIISANFNSQPKNVERIKRRIGYGMVKEFPPQDEKFSLQVSSREFNDMSSIKYIGTYYNRPIEIEAINAYDDDYLYCGGGIYMKYCRDLETRERIKIEGIIREYEKRNFGFFTNSFNI
jgi:hypothetical protein